MSTFTPIKAQGLAGIRQYRQLPLAELITLIVENSDTRALGEFHKNRTVFQHQGKHPMLFVQYVDYLREDAIARGEGEIANDAYYLTIDKFSNFPESSTDVAASTPSDEKRTPGTDCHNYFHAFLNGFRERVDGLGDISPIEEENMAAKVLQGLVARHYHLSLLESQRRTPPSMSRYVWKFPNGDISLLMPKEIAGKKRRAWLEANVKDPDPTQPWERQRVQSIINEKLGSPTILFDDRRLYGTLDPASMRVPGMNWRSMSISAHGLANIVGEEKAENIDKQRPGIKELGAGPLKEMILRIFYELGYGEYYDADIARKFGVGKATYSRFAGSRWQGSKHGVNKSIPDLWANTARILATNPEFVDAAKDTGLWQRAVRTFEQRGVLLEGGTTDE